MAAQKCDMANRNPWGLIPSYWYADRPGAGRPGGTARYRYFFQYRGPNGSIRLGPNHDILGNALFLLRACRLTGEKRYFDAACRQIDWVLGCNPFDASTVEGVGLNQPLRFINGGEFFRLRPKFPVPSRPAFKATTTTTPSRLATIVPPNTTCRPPPCSCGC